jgi:diguanylate cyclase (GGDEF)-like protein
MKREAVSSSLRSTGPSHYALVDMHLATRLGGAMWLIAAAYALVLLPLAPPQHGAWGWAGVLAAVVLGLAFGLRLIRRRTPAVGPELLLGVYVAMGLAVLLSYSVGSGSPAPQLLLIALLYSAAIHPPRHVLVIALIGSAAHFLPLAWIAAESEFAPHTASQVLLGWSLSAVLLAWSMGVRRQRLESRQAREEARLDSLTSLGNKRALDESLGSAVRAARSLGRPLSALVADLDDFKSVNDVHGHQAGDALLRDVAAAFVAALRDGDPCFRWGGDEFVALLPGTDLETARQIAVRVIAGVATNCIRPDGDRARITVGAAELLATEDGQALIDRADADLLLAKETGGRSFRLVEGASG